MFTSLLRNLLIALSVLLSVNVLAQSLYQATADINIRSGPGPGYKSVGVVSKGKEVEIIDSSNSNWFKAKYKGITGFIAHKYIIRAVVQTQPPKITPKPKSQAPPKTSKLSLFGWILFLVSLVLIIIGLINRVTKSQQKVQVKSSQEKQTKGSSFQQPVKPIGMVINPTSQNASSKVVRGDKIITTQTNSTQSEKVISQKTSSNRMNSIEDITGKSQPITYGNSFVPVANPGSAPYWRHQYIYSARELNSAAAEQKAFYLKFKSEFIQYTWLDLAGSSNYAFILLFDLYEDYKIHGQLDQLEHQYRFLWKNWPKTESYARDILIRQMGLIGDNHGINRLNAEKPSYNSGFNFDESYWGLGNRYKEKFKLNNEQVKILNNLIDTSNSFNSMEYCARAIIFSFFHVLEELEKHLKSEATSLEDQAKAIAEIELLRHYKFKKGSNNYKTQIKEFIKTIHQAIYKTCENSLRDFLFVGRKTDLSYYIHSAEALQQFNTVFPSAVHDLLMKYFSTMTLPDDATEAELNQYGKGRWKSKLEKLKEGCSDENAKLFYDTVVKLGAQNAKNPSVENIFLEASKFVTKYDAVISLKLYIYYIYYDLLSTTFDNKQLTKTIQKSLFKTADQVKEFQEIINDLIRDKQLDKALEKVSSIYKTKRKKIQIDTSKIKEVQEQHAETVDLLNEYLQDENEVVEQFSGAKETELNLNVKVSNELSQKSIFKEEIGLTVVQINALTLFLKNGFVGSYDQLELFARENGVFRNSLIEGINENCYPVFDDILIEDEDGAYRVNESYYQQILVS